MDGHILFGMHDVQTLNDHQRHIIVGCAMRVCKRCGRAEVELQDRCEPRTPVVLVSLADGKRIQARLVSENHITAIVKPHLWIKSKAIKVHKRKSNMKYTRRWI